MKAKQAAFTLVEILIVMIVIVTLSTIVVPRLMVSTISANESAVIRTLRAIASTQLQTRNEGDIDSNADGIGEYGYFQELSGVRGTRRDEDGDGLCDTESLLRVLPPALPSTFGLLDNDGLIRVHGYLFRMLLPGRDGEFLRELPTTDRYPLVSGVLATSYWACYAWPTGYDVTGRRAFFVNQEGRVLVAPNDRTMYSGLELIQGAELPGPKSIAAYAPGESLMSGPMAIDANGQDDNLWKPLK